MNWTSLASPGGGYAKITEGKIIHTLEMEYVGLTDRSGIID
jgi:hypothetical protein